MTTVSLGPLATDPAGVTQALAETVPWGIDMTKALTNVSGGTVTSPSSVLTDLTADKTVTLADSPTVSGNIVTQIVRGSVLTLNHTYRLEVTFTAASNTILSTITTITVPA